MRLRKYILAAGIAMSALLGAGVSDARANSVELFFLGATTVGGTTSFRYQVELTPGNFVSNNPAGDSIVLFDFEGYQSATFTPTGLLAGGGNYTLASTADAQTTYTSGGYQTGSPPGFLNGTADLGFADIRFDYSGPSFSNTTAVDVILGVITVNSSVSSGTVDLTFTTDTANGSSPPGTGRFQEIIVARSGGLALVPLPGAVWGGLALFGLVGGARLRKRRRLA